MGTRHADMPQKSSASPFACALLASNLPSWCRPALTQMLLPRSNSLFKGPAAASKSASAGAGAAGRHDTTQAASQQQPGPASLPQRKIIDVVKEDHTIEGPGFEICRPFPTRKMQSFDPW